MNSNDVNVGLLSNSQNPKYKQTSSEGYQIELQDINDEPSYIAFDEKENQCQYAELPLQNPWNQPARQMLRNDAPQQPVPKNPPPLSSSLPSQSPQVQIQASMWNVSQSQTYYTQQSLIDNRSGQQPIQHQSLPQQQQYRPQQQYACCTFCQTSQLIGNPNTPFMCYACKKIVQANFSYFICGVCRTNVMYQTGVSNIIKCTKCMTVNYVQQPNLPNQSPQPPQQQKPQAQTQAQAPPNQPARSAPQQSKILGNQVDPL